MNTPIHELAPVDELQSGATTKQIAEKVNELVRLCNQLALDLLGSDEIDEAP